jgi:hypothetical protein
MDVSTSDLILERIIFPQVQTSCQNLMLLFFWGVPFCKREDPVSWKVIRKCTKFNILLCLEVGVDCNLHSNEDVQMNW